MQVYSTKKLKSLICQIKPELKNKNQNLKRVSISLQKYNAIDQIDIVLFPEMSFVGYNFQDSSDALTMACQVNQGEEYEFCSSEAKRLNAYFVFGYIEKSKQDDKQALYNSVMVLDRKGVVIQNARKHHLYYNDKLWSKQGSQFKSIKIKNTNGDNFDCGICICMDINPKQFISGKFEFADFFKKNNLQVILFITNWVNHEDKNVNQNQSIISIYNYWLHRLTPILNSKNSPKKKSMLFLASDRVGEQYSYYDDKNISFFGASCAIKLNPNNILQSLDKKSEGYLLVQTNLPK